jgi:hypothetical protein
MAAVVVRVSKVGKHPKADNLEITTVNGRSTIFPTGDFKPGDKAVWIEPGTIVKTRDYRFSWLSKKPLYRVGKIYLRKVPSYGFLLKNQYDDPVGYDVSQYYGVVRPYQAPVKVSAKLPRLWDRFYGFLFR